MRRIDHHVGGGQRIAGVKFHVVAQMKGQGFAVGADIPGFRQRGLNIGELLRIKLHQRVVEVDHDPHHSYRSSPPGPGVSRLFIFIPMMSWSGGVFAIAALLPIDTASASKHAASREVFFISVCLYCGVHVAGWRHFRLIRSTGPQPDKRSAIGHLFFLNQSWLTVLASIYAKLMSSPRPGRCDKCTNPWSSMGRQGC